ncbi:MAG: pilus assembly protein TadE [Massilia sp.]|nr:pilus assembly protein TadE [Massilia sp.]
MYPIKYPNEYPTARWPSPARQRGAYLVELSLLLLTFLLLVAGVIEVARTIYLFNTLQEVTRRAAQRAAVTNYRNTAAMNALRQGAIFRTSPGTLRFGDPVSDRHVLIDYLALVRANDGTLTPTPISAGGMPSCPSRNRHICSADPNDRYCIRFVRVRICEPGSGAACTPVSYRPLMGLIPFAFTLPRSTTIVSAESLGYVPGATMCP